MSKVHNRGKTVGFRLGSSLLESLEEEQLRLDFCQFCAAEGVVVTFLSRMFCETKITEKEITELMASWTAIIIDVVSTYRAVGELKREKEADREGPPKSSDERKLN